MDWRDWELFCEVVEHGGFSAAARVLGHPKSSLSAAVQRLEGHLGLRLIERTTRHLRLTDAGDTIYRRVQPLFIALHETKSEALAMSSAVAGTLRIKSPYEFGAHHAGPVACELMARYPDLTIRIDVEHEIVNPVAENYDIVFAMLEAPLPSAGIVIRRVFTLERGLFAAPSLLERFGEPRTLRRSRATSAAGRSRATRPGRSRRPAARPNISPVEKARLVSSNAHIRLQAATRRPRRAAGDRELHPRRGRGRLAEARCCRTMSASRCPCMRCCRRASSCRPRCAPSWMRWKSTPMGREALETEPLPG